MSTDSAILALLPPRLREIAAVVGVDATLSLASALGGVRMYVPKHIKPQHPIAQAIGMDKAEALSKAFGLHYFSLPMGRRYQDALVKARALERYYTGESAAKVARAYGLHEMTLYKWAGIEKQAMANQQTSLF